MPPNCQPFAAHATGPDFPFTPGISHVPERDSTWATSKSDGALRMCESKRGRVETELVKAVWNESEPVSRLFDHVYAPCICIPLLKRVVTRVLRAWYVELTCH